MHLLELPTPVYNHNNDTVYFWFLIFLFKVAVSLIMSWANSYKFQHIKISASVSSFYWTKLISDLWLKKL